MAKRFLDTSIFRDPSVRAMKAPYKVLYLYLLCECDHAGVWICEMDVAALRLGMKLGGRDEVLAELAGAVIDLGGGAWYVVDFVRSQYGKLNPANRVHASVMDRLQGLGMDPLNLPENKPLTSPLQGCKDKDKDKDKDNSEKKGTREAPEIWPSFADWWKLYAKGSRKLSAEVWEKLSQADREAAMAATPPYLQSRPEAKYRKDGERFLKNRTWEDPIIDNSTPKTANNGPHITKPSSLSEADKINAALAILQRNDAHHG